VFVSPSFEIVLNFDLFVVEDKLFEKIALSPNLESVKIFVPGWIKAFNETKPLRVVGLGPSLL
jgi:hypothetical protein